LSVFRVYKVILVFPVQEYRVYRAPMVFRGLLAVFRVLRVSWDLRDSMVLRE
jgi:hypothetical protein